MSSSMSHGEGDDWWDAFSTPQWFVEFIEYLNLIKRGEKLNSEKIQYVNNLYNHFIELQSKWHNHG